eukprot:766950-Hanusia_phi.AAC.3
MRFCLKSVYRGFTNELAQNSGSYEAFASSKEERKQSLKFKCFRWFGGKKGLKKRMKRWKARKKKRFEIKSGIRKESRNTKLANKGQVKVQKEKKATKDIKRRKGRKIERGKK